MPSKGKITSSKKKSRLLTLLAWNRLRFGPRSVPFKPIHSTSRWFSSEKIQKVSKLPRLIWENSIDRLGRNSVFSQAKWNNWNWELWWSMWIAPPSFRKTISYAGIVHRVFCPVPERIFNAFQEVVISPNPQKKNGPPLRPKGGKGVIWIQKKRGIFYLRRGHWIWTLSGMK